MRPQSPIAKEDIVAPSAWPFIRPSVTRISVIITLFNKAEFIERTIESVARPGWAAKEIIVVDDGSSDGSDQIALRMAEKHPEVRVLRNPSKGSVSALNFGISQAKGDYIFILDGDDVCLPWRYQISCAVLDNFPQVVLVTGRPVEATKSNLDEVWSLCKSEVAACPSVTTMKVDASRYFSDNSIAHSQCAFRKSAWHDVGGYRKTPRGTCIDYDFYVRTLEFGDHWRLNIPLSINLHDPSSTYIRAARRNYVADFRRCQLAAYRTGQVSLTSLISGNLRYARRYLAAVWSEML